MPTGGWSATQISTTKLNSIASVRLTQPSLASQTQCTSNSIASAPPLADPSSSLSNGSQDDGAPLGGPPAILIAAVGSKRLKVRLRFAAEDAASYASTEAMPETAMVLRPKPAVKRSKIYGDGNPTRVGKGNWRARAEEIDFSSSATIEEAIPSYAGKKYGQLAFPLSLLDLLYFHPVRLLTNYYSFQALTSRLLNATEHSQQSFNARVADKPVAKRRKQSDQALKESQLEDRAAQRSNTTMINVFHKSSVAIQPAPGVDNSSWRMRNNMLMTFEESGDRRETQVSVHLSHGGDDAFQEMMELALDGGGFNRAVQKHINKTGMMPEPVAAATAGRTNRQVKTTLITEAEWRMILDNRAASGRVSGTAAVDSGAANAVEVAVGDGSSAPIGIGNVDAVLQHAGLCAAV